MLKLAQFSRLKSPPSQTKFSFKQTQGLYINIINPEEEEDQMKHEGQWTR